MSETLAKSDVHNDRLLQARFFAVPAGAKRDRRPTDVVVLVTSLVVLALFATRAGEPLRGFEAALSELVNFLPAFLDPVWQIAYDALAVWAFCVTAVAVARRRWGLVRDLAITVVAVICFAALVGRWTNGTWPDVVDGLFGTDGLADYPAVGLALWVAIGSVASSHVSRPYRYLGRWIAIAGGCAAVALGVTTPSGSIGAVALGLAVAASVHLCFGSPGGLPSMAQVQAALAGIGVEAEPFDVTRRSGSRACPRSRRDRRRARREDLRQGRVGRTVARLAVEVHLVPRRRADPCRDEAAAGGARGIPDVARGTSRSRGQPGRGSRCRFDRRRPPRDSSRRSASRRDRPRRWTSGSVSRCGGPCVRSTARASRTDRSMPSGCSSTVTW